MSRPPSPAPEGAPGRDPLAGKQIVLCVTGGIAAYKSAILTRALVKSGARVHVVMTANAQRFVGPLTFATLSGNPVVTSSFESVHGMGAVEHVDLASWADLVLVAPATYNLLGKLHAGVADDAVTTLLAAVAAPVVLAPAMNDRMWRQPVNQRNVAALRGLGYQIVDPERGGLACSWEGEGRMREPEAILEAVRDLLRVRPVLGPAERSALAGFASATSGTADANGFAGRTLLVSAAGTQEAIDPVRFIGNRSSGRMGFALAEEAARRGGRVLLVSGPSPLADPPGVAEVKRVRSAEEMLFALRVWLPQADALVMAAAVADFRPSAPAEDKLKRGAGPLRLELEPTPDLLQELRAGKGRRLFVGFALETGALESAARDKLQRKGLDLVVANRVGPGTGPEGATNQVWVYDAAGLVLETPLLDKPRIAAAILDLVEARLPRAEE
jgi:phosphopantothenoylcysteine decarboxylase/phosphopantothenate--cysteine ligase